MILVLLFSEVNVNFPEPTFKQNNLKSVLTNVKFIGINTCKIQYYYISFKRITSLSFLSFVLCLYFICHKHINLSFLFIQ